MEDVMANPVEIKKADKPAPVAAQAGDVWRSMRQEMERLFDRFSAPFENGNFGNFPAFDRLWSQGPDFAALAVDIASDDKAYTITAELPGLDEKDVEVTIGDDALSFKGEKRQVSEEKTKNRYVAERSYGAFQRSFALPKDADRKAIAATFAKGVLTITIPKAAAVETQQKIEVKAA
jgi:HSP20 family protein